MNRIYACILPILGAVFLSCDPSSSNAVDIHDDNPWEVVQINGLTYILSNDDARPDLSMEIPYNRKEGNRVDISNLIFVDGRGFAVDCVGDSLINEYFDFTE